MKPITKHIFYISLFITLIFFNYSTLHACMCGDHSFKEEFNSASLVFKGKLSSEDKHKYTFRVLKTYKGPISDQYNIYRNNRSFNLKPEDSIHTDCDFPFTPNVEYYVFAYGKEFYYTPSCGATATVSKNFLLTLQLNNLFYPVIISIILTIIAFIYGVLRILKNNK